MTKIFINDSFQNFAPFPNPLVRISLAHFAWRNPFQKVWVTNPGNDPEGIVKGDLSYISQIFLPKLMGNDPKPCGFIYMIGAFTSMKFPQIALFPYFWALWNELLIRFSRWTLHWFRKLRAKEIPANSKTMKKMKNSFE